MIVLGRWERLQALGTSKDFVLVTPIEGRAGVRERGAKTAVLCFLAAVGLTYTGTLDRDKPSFGRGRDSLLRVISIDKGSTGQSIGGRSC